MTSAEDDAGWDDWQDDANDGMVYRSLFTDSEFKSPAEAFAHMKENNSFDLLAIQKQYALDQYGCIRLINYVRSKVKADASLGTPGSFATPAAEDFAAEEFFMPVMEDDAMLMHDYEQHLDAAAGAGDSDTAEVAALKAELAMVKEAFAIYRESSEQALLGGMRANELRDDAAAAPNRNSKKPKAAGDGDGDDSDSDNDADLDAELDSYFSSYTHFGIHEEMLKDKVRTESYRNSMYFNKEFFAGKTVLDVGCGTGILSMMAARAGAAKVIGIDNSGIIAKAKEIVELNGLGDVITLIRGKVEDLDSITVDKVDIIISEWMGYFLFFESMLDTVLYARDKWLKPGGVVLPDRCSLHVVAVSDPERYKNRVTFWNEVYEFKMAPMKEKLFFEPDITVVDASKIVSDPVLLKDTDCCTTSAEALEFDTSFELKVDKDCVVSGLCVYFDTFFAKIPNAVEFSTGPKATPTHWKQTLFYLEKPISLKAGESLVGKMKACRHREYHRSWHVQIKYTSGSEEMKQTYKV